MLRVAMKKVAFVEVPDPSTMVLVNACLPIGYLGPHATSSMSTHPIEGSQEFALPKPKSAPGSDRYHPSQML